MNTVESRMLDVLKKASVEFELYSHAPVLRSSDRVPMGLDFGGAVCKNLFLTTRSKSHYMLVLMLESNHADLRALARHYNSSRLTFASDEDVENYLGLRSGSIGVSGLTDPRSKDVELVVDSGLTGRERICLHPGDVSKTVVIGWDGLLDYVHECGFEPSFYDFSDGGNNV